MTTKITIHYKQEQRRNATSSLTSQMECQLKVSGAAIAEHSSSKRFRRVFIFDNDAPGTKVEVTATIPAMTGMNKPIMQVKQVYVIVEEEGTRGKASRQLKPVPHRHPRVYQSVNMAAGKGSAFDVVLDTTFLNVTEYIGSCNRVDKDTRKSVDDFRQSVVKAGAFRATCSLVVFEHTTLGGPPVWAMLLPPKWKSSVALVNLFLYFRPSRNDPTYKNSDIVPFDMFTRYCDYDKMQDGSVARGHFHDGQGFAAFRRCCFEEQLALSARNVILVSPLPQGADYGLLTSATLCKGGGMLDKLLATLWAESLTGVGGKEQPILKRLALGGFSQGGVQCQAAFESNQEKVSELYLFDPGSGISASVVPWFKKDCKNRRLRMIGTAYSEETAMQRDASIRTWMVSEGVSITGHWTVKPGDGTYWYANARYHQGLSHPDVGIDRFDPATATTASRPATTESNLYLKKEKVTPHAGKPSEGRVELVGRWVGGNAERWVGGNIGAVEAAAFARHRVIAEDNAGHPVQDEAQFNKVVVKINVNDFNEEKAERSKVIRHEWAVVGGELRGSDYWGYLRWCLADSLFT